MDQNSRARGNTPRYEFTKTRTCQNRDESRAEVREKVRDSQKKKRTERQKHQLLLRAGNSIVYSSPHSASQCMSAVCVKFIHECVYMLCAFRYGFRSVDECLTVQELCPYMPASIPTFMSLRWLVLLIPLQPVIYFFFFNLRTPPKPGTRSNAPSSTPSYKYP